jgi:hypothetical protein
MNLVGWTVAQYYKERFARSRPSQLNPTLRPVIRVPAHPSYPSGHATQVHLVALALQETLGLAEGPLHAEIGELAARIAINREFALVHYRSDSDAGEALAQAIWDLVMKNANFQAFIEAARAEWLNRPGSANRRVLAD